MVLQRSTCRPPPSVSWGTEALHHVHQGTDDTHLQHDNSALNLQLSNKSKTSNQHFCNDVLQITPDNAGSTTTTTTTDHDLNAAGPQHTTPNVGASRSEASIAWPALLLQILQTRNLPQTRTTLRHTVGTHEHICRCIKAVCPLRADLGVVSLHHDMVQRDNFVIEQLHVQALSLLYKSSLDPEYRYLLDAHLRGLARWV